ncbi:MAG TPA: hypothetical protein VKF82_07355 [Candidatus Eremiobacteraceae bacterium]|nr:hypothetical protein [Candidatus Eremiobacteraceae bacterium]
MSDSQQEAPIPHTSGSREADVLRVCGVVVSAWLLWNAYYIWVNTGTVEHADAAVVTFAAYLLFFAVSILTLQGTLPHHYPIALLSGLGIGLCMRAYAMLHYVLPVITTDGLALSLYAAELFLRGINPYGLDLAASYDIFHVPIAFNTPLIEGGVVGSMPYPALAFLSYIPALLIHVDPRWVDVCAVLVSIALLYAIAPRHLRSVAILVFLVDPGSIDFSFGSEQDILYLAPLMLAAFFWTQMPAAAGAFFGIACAIKQDPWLDAPFFFIGVIAAAPAGRRVHNFVRAVAAAFAAFMLPNAYFAITKPAAWAAGVFEPFIAHHVEWGAGLVNIVLSGHVHWAPEVLTRVAAGVFIALLLVAALFFKPVRNLVWLAPGLTLLVAPRSLENYFLFLLPVCLASWFGSLPDAIELKESLAGAFAVRMRRWLPAAAAVVLITALFGCGKEPPIHATISGLYDSHHLGFIDKVSLSVRNDSDDFLGTTYLMAYDFIQYLWRCETGCEPVPPHGTQAVVIAAPDNLAAIPAGSLAQVRIVNARTGEEYLSNRFLALTPIVHIPNPQLAIPVNRGYVVPAAWSLNVGDMVDGSISYVRGGGRRGTVGITLMPTKNPALMWTTRSVQQNYVPFDQPITARVSKTILFKADAAGHPTQFAGIEIYGDDDFVTFCWGDVASTQVVESGGLYVVEPVQSSSDDLLIDLWKYARPTGFPKGATFRLSFVAAAVRPAAPLHVTFSGFDLLGQSNTVQPVQFKGSP